MSAILVGVTGGIACGKSTVAARLVKIAKRWGQALGYVELDHMKREVLEQRGGNNEVQQKLISHFGGKIKRLGGGLDRSALSLLMAHEPGASIFIEGVLRAYLADALERTAREHAGVVLVEDALLVEREFLPLVKNNVLLVSCCYATQRKRLGSTELSKAEQLQRLHGQQSNRQKLVSIENAQSCEGHGKLFLVDTEQWPTNEYCASLYRALCTLEVPREKEHQYVY